MRGAIRRFVARAATPAGSRVVSTFQESARQRTRQAWRLAPLAGAFLAALWCVAVAPAQNGLVIRTETRLVMVDAVVRDKAGRMVRDLEAKDFQVWEDGKEQTISSFHREAAGSPEPQAQPRYIAFLFSSGLAQKDRDRVNDFVASYARRGRYVAAVAYPRQMKVVQNFTDSAERFKRALAQFGTEAGGAGVNAVSVQSQASSGRGGGSYGAGDSRLLYSVSPPWWTSALRDLAEGVMGIRGRKLVVVLDAMGRPTDDSYVADACNRANLGVYTTHSDLQQLAKKTGGRVIDYKDLGRELAGIAGEQEESYVLGFTPRDWAEGSCHSLRVRVGRADVDVRSRERYCAVKPADDIAAKVTGKALEEHAAAAAAGVPSSVRLPYFYAGPNVALIDLAMETAPLDLKFEKVNGKQHAQLDVVGQAFTAEGAAAGRFSETVKLDFATDREADEFRKQPYHYQHQFRLAAGRYNVRIAFGLGERGAGQSGSAAHHRALGRQAARAERHRSLNAGEAGRGPGFGPGPVVAGRPEATHRGRARDHPIRRSSLPARGALLRVPGNLRRLAGGAER